MTEQEVMRRAVENNYDVQNGIIRTPGKFEGEAIYVPYFWDVYLNGFSDRDDGCIIGFDLTAEDRQAFPELKGRRTVRLMERDDGFVCEL